MWRVCLLALLLLAGVVALPGADDTPRAPGIEDLLALKTIGGVQISPDWTLDRAPV